MLICSFTTLGSTFAATCSTEPAGAEPEGGTATGTFGAGAAAVAAVAALLTADASGWLAHIAAPAPPETTATAAAPAITMPVRDFLRTNAIGAVGCESG